MFMTINQTAKTSGVSYIYDRVSGQFKLPSFAELITLKSQALPFQASAALDLKIPKIFTSKLG